MNPKVTFYRNEHDLDSSAGESLSSWQWFDKGFGLELTMKKLIFRGSPIGLKNNKFRMIPEEK